MADQNVSIGVNVSELNSGIQSAVQAFQTQITAGQNLAVTFIKLNEATQQYTIGTRSVSDSGKEVNSVIKLLGDTAELTSRKMTQVATSIRTNLATAFRDVNKEIRDFQQTASLNAFENALKKQTAAAAAATAAQTKLNAERIKGEELARRQGLGQTGQGILQSTPIPTGTTQTQLNTLRSAMAAMTAAATKAGLSVTELKQRFDQLRTANPTASFAKGNQDLIAFENTARRVIQAQANLGRSAEDAGRAGARGAQLFTISWQGALRLIEAQTIRRLFTGLIQQINDSVSAAIKFQQAVAEVRTISQGLSLTAGDLSRELIDISIAFNRTPVDTARAAYEAFSNQIIKSAGDLSFLTESARFSRIAVASLEDSTNLLSSTLNAFKRSVFETRSIADTLFKAIDIGRFKAADLANTFGRVGVTAAQMNVSLGETLAFLTLITRQGVPLAEAQTQLNSLFKSLLTPSEQLGKLFNELGFASGRSAVQLLGVRGVLQLLFIELQKGGDRLGELLPNVRALRGFFGAGGDAAAQFQKDLEQLENSTDLAAEALRRIQETPAEQLLKEFNKVKIFFQEDFGNSIINSLLELSRPFGGLEGLVRNLTSVLLEAVQGVLLLGRVFAEVTAFLSIFSVNLGSLVKFFIVYKTTQAIISVTILALTGLHTAYGAAIGFVTTKILGQTIATQAAAAANTQLATSAALAGTASTGAGVAAAGWGASLKAVAPAVVTLGFAFVAAAKLALDFFREMHEQTEKFEKDLQIFRESSRLEEESFNREETTRLQAFEKSVLEKSRSLGFVITEILKQYNKLADEQAVQLKKSSRDFERSSNRILEAQDELISNLRKGITEARNEIKKTVKELENLKIKRDEALFGERLGAFGIETFEVSSLSSQQIQRIHQQNAAQTRVEQAKLDLIENRISTLRARASELAQTGTVESINQIQELYKEIEKLDKDRFDISTERERRRIETGARIAAGTGGGPQTREFIVPINELEAQRVRRERELRDLSQQTIGIQNNVIQNNERLLEQEIDKRERIQQSIEALSTFRVIGGSGSLLPRFDQDGGIQAARNEIERLRDEAQTTIGTVVLSTNQLTILEEKVGRAGARSIQQALDAIRRNVAGATLTEQQINQLQTHLGDTQTQIIQQRVRFYQDAEQRRVAITAQAEREIRVAHLKTLDEQRISEQNALVASERANSTANAERVAGFRQVAIRSAQILQQARVLLQGGPTGEGSLTVNSIFGPIAQQQINESVLRRARELQGGPQRLPGFRPTITSELRTQILQEITSTRELARTRLEAAQAAQTAFERDRSPENAQRLIEAQGSFSQAFRDFINLVGTSSERASTSIGGLSDRFRQEANILADLNRVSREANDRFRTSQERVAFIGEQAEALISRLPPEMQTSIRTAQIAANQISGAFGNVTTSLETVITRLDTFITRLGELNGIVVQPSIAVRTTNVGADSDIIFPQNAKGGLLGGRFNTFGSDNTLISARTGEYIVNPTDTRRFYPQLVAINQGRIPHFDRGGLVGESTNIGDISITVNESKSPNETARAILNKIQREKRRRR